MEILEKAFMPDGTKIQIEDWRKDYSCFKTVSIAAYPIMKRLPQSKKIYWHNPGEMFRVSITSGFESDCEVKTAFEDLKAGRKSIMDFADRFWDLWNAECL